MPQVWCPYLGKYVNEESCNVEHVIPGSLGGTNAFTIKTDAKKNNDLGSQLDQVVLNLPIISTAVRHYRLSGHRKSRHTVRWPGRIAGTKGSAVFSDSGVEFETFRSFNEYGLNLRRILLPSESFEATLAIDVDVLLSFAAKVALGAGWFLFGKTFQEWGHHDELRQLMDTGRSVRKLRSMMAFQDSFWAAYWPKSLDDRVGDLWWHRLAKLPDRHLIWTLHTTAEVVMAVNLFGLFPCYFNISQNALKFPVGGDFDLGTVLELHLRTRKTSRSSLRQYILREKPNWE